MPSEVVRRSHHVLIASDSHLWISGGWRSRFLRTLFRFDFGTSECERSVSVRVSE